MFYCYTHYGTCNITIHIVAIHIVVHIHIVIHELGTMYNVMDRLLNVPVGDLTTHE